MKKIWLCLVLLVSAAVSVYAEDHREEHEERGEYEEHHDEIEILERNVRLEFKTVPLEKGDQGVFIITASPEYEIGIRLEGDDGEFSFEASGEIELLDDGRIFVFYEAHTAMRGDDGELEFKTRAGVILKPGKQLGVSKIGNKTLMITATYVAETGKKD
jgi:hypothetical protein